MLAESRAEVIRTLPEDALVLDVGGWANPLARADWVVDLMPYETRGLYGEADPDPERFSADTWLVRDICDRVPWPFADNEFDFAVCSHTLEDVRDPVWVCGEMSRVARAGYIEVPARCEEQTRGLHGPWVGWSHHHWLIDVEDQGLEFVFKPHLLHGRPEFWVPLEWTEALPPERRVNTLFWTESLPCRERVFHEPEELHAWLAAVAVRYGAPVGSDRSGPRGTRARDVLRALLSRRPFDRASSG